MSNNVFRANGDKIFVFGGNNNYNAEYFDIGDHHNCRLLPSYGNATKTALNTLPAALFEGRR